MKCSLSLFPSISLMKTSFLILLACWTCRQDQIGSQGSWQDLRMGQKLPFTEYRGGEGKSRSQKGYEVLCAGQGRSGADTMGKGEDKYLEGKTSVLRCTTWKYASLMNFGKYQSTRAGPHALWASFVHSLPSLRPLMVTLPDPCPEWTADLSPVTHFPVPSLTSVFNFSVLHFSIQQLIIKWC